MNTRCDICLEWMSDMFGRTMGVYFVCDYCASELFKMAHGTIAKKSLIARRKNEGGMPQKRPRTAKAE